MANHLSALLQQWHPHRDQLDWVLGTIIATQGSAYRKAGARMLFNSDGQQYGLLSGGCLESDLLREARKVMHTGQPATITYDMQDEDDIAWQLGIGCGGMVHIQLNLINAANQYLGLEHVFQGLQQGFTRWHWLLIEVPSATGQNDIGNLCDNTGSTDNTKARWRITESLAEQTSLRADTNSVHQCAVETLSYHQQNWLVSRVHSEPHLLVFGGGIDARPLVAIAAELGWQVSLIDQRPAYARDYYFPGANRIIKKAAQSLGNSDLIGSVDAVVIMTHNLAMDADALSVIAQSNTGTTPSPITYLGILGPLERRQRLLGKAGLHLSDLPGTVSGPAGLDLGGELPESIALAILAEAHAALYQGSGARVRQK